MIGRGQRPKGMMQGMQPDRMGLGAGSEDRWGCEGAESPSAWRVGESKSQYKCVKRKQTEGVDRAGE